jgi:hypothetical protein
MGLRHHLAVKRTLGFVKDQNVFLRHELRT